MPSMFTHYLNQLRLEPFMYTCYRVLVLPLWMQYQRVRPSSETLPYETLLEMNRHFPKAQKRPGEAETQQQKKWGGRVAQLANHFGADKILEVGCGYGFASLYVKKTGKKVCTTDVVDNRFPEVRAAGIPFEIGDVCERLPYVDNAFDMVFSINSCEHFLDPKKAIDESLRVTRPGGIVFLAFSPLYYSPWGLHASRRLGMPYPQLLFSSETIQRFVDEKKHEIEGTYDAVSDKSMIGPYVNGYSIQQYRSIFKNLGEGAQQVAYVETVSLDGRKILSDYPEIVKGHTPSFVDLITSGIKVVIEKT